MQEVHGEQNFSSLNKDRIQQCHELETKAKIFAPVFMLSYIFYRLIFPQDIKRVEKY